MSHFLLSGSIFSQTKGLASITKSELRGHIVYLASDNLEGRSTGSEGLKKAAQYLSDKLKSFGFESREKNSMYSQKFKIHKGKFSEKSYITIIKNGEEKKFPTGSDYFFSPLFNANGKEKGRVVFLGKSDSQLLSSNLVWNNFGIMGIGSSLSTFDNKQFFRSLAPVIRFQPKGLFFIASLYDEAKWSELQTISLFGQTELSSMKNISPLEYFFPLVEVNREFLKELTGLTEKEREKFVNRIEGFEDVQPFFIENTEIEIALDFNEERIETENIFGIYEGSDADLKDEYIVVGAHYDHLGILNGEIYNGADDNASGVAALLELAEALTFEKPKRSVVVVFFTAEEGGITGSEYFVSHFPGDIKKVVSYINLDMVGRSSGNRVYAIGGDLVSEKLGEIYKTMNEKYINLTIDNKYNSFDDPEKFYRRGDQIHFGKKDIPFIDFFTGLHPDYHKPSDDTERINWGDLDRISKLAFLTCLEAANTESEIKMNTKVPKEDY